jgi:hypothetical protein
MAVRAKFKVVSITEMEGYDYSQDPVKPAPMYTIKASPVYGNGDPEHENTKFWQASPSGSLELGTINAAAAAQFKVGQEFYLDFTPAE